MIEFNNQRLPENVNELLDVVRNNEEGLKTFDAKSWAVIWALIFGSSIPFIYVPVGTSLAIALMIAGLGAAAIIPIELVLLMALFVISTIITGAIGLIDWGVVSTANFLKLDGGISTHQLSLMKTLHHNYYYNPVDNDSKFWFFYPREKYQGILLPLQDNDNKPLYKISNIGYIRNQNQKEGEEYSDQEFEFKEWKSETNTDNAFIEKMSEEYKEKIGTLEKEKEEVAKVVNSIKEEKNNEIEIRIEKNFDLRTYEGYCIVLTNDQIKSILEHSFLDTKSTIDLFNFIQQIQINVPCAQDSDGFFQKFGYSIIKKEDDITYVTGPIFMGHLVKLDDNGEITKYDENGIYGKKVFLKENGWFTTCENYNQNDYINCNPLKTKKEKKCWTVNLDNKGFHFLDMVDAALHDSTIAAGCAYDNVILNNIKSLQEAIGMSEPQSGGDLEYYKKYIKYKNKYFELKNSLKM